MNSSRAIAAGSTALWSGLFSGGVVTAGAAAAVGWLHSSGAAVATLAVGGACALGAGLLARHWVMARVGRLEAADPLSRIDLGSQGMRALIDRLPSGVILIDRDLVARYWSARCGQLFGWTETEIVGKPIVQTFARGFERDVLQISERISVVEPGGELAVYESSTPIHARDGRELVCRFTSIGLRGGNSELTGYLLVAQDVTAQAQAEAALRQSEQHYRMLFEENPQPMWIMDARLPRFLAVNRAAATTYGWSQEEFLQVAPSEIGSVSEIAELEAWGRQFIAASVALGPDAGSRGEPPPIQHTGPWMHRLRDGREILVECVSNGLWMNGVPARLTTSFDVTAREQALEEVRASEQRLELLTENLPVGVFRASASGLCEYVNPRWVEMTGISFEQSLGRGWAACVHPEDLPDVHKRWVDAVEGKVSAGFEHRLRHVDGRVLWVQGQGHPLRREDGSIYGVVGTVVDLTERHAIERELRIAAAAFQQQEGIIVSDENSIVLRVNQAFCDATGYSEQEVVGRSTKFLRSDRHDEAFFDERRKQIVATGHWSGEVWNRRKNGEVYPEWVNVTAVKDAEGRVTHYVGSFLDITERKRAEIALLESQRELGQLTRRLMEQEKQMTSHLAQALHDCLGQTLGALRLHIDAMRAKLATGQFDSAAATALPRVSSLVEQAVLEVRNVLVDLRPPLLDQLGLAAALDNELQVRRRDATEVELQLTLDGSPPASRWPADVEYAAFMIAREAIGNALKHARATRITCSLGGAPLHLKLRVEDDGAGLPGPTERPGHLGVVGMRERALAIGADFDIQSSAGAGVVVELDWQAVK